MKTMIAALALVLAAGPTFAKGSHTTHLQEVRASAYVPQSGFYAFYGTTDTSREWLIRSF